MDRKIKIKKDEIKDKEVLRMEENKGGNMEGNMGGNMEENEGLNRVIENLLSRLDVEEPEEAGLEEKEGLGKERLGKEGTVKKRGISEADRPKLRTEGRKSRGNEGVEDFIQRHESVDGRREFIGWGGRSGGRSGG